jgi:hypothetical protein
MSKKTFSASIDLNNFSGKFTSLTPLSAAKKFINTLDSDKKYNIYIKNIETEKIYKYKGAKNILDEPQVVNLSNGKSITYNYKNNVKRIF